MPRGPNGRRLCRECGTETKPPRRTFCSARCVDQWTLKTDPRAQRRAVWARDDGRCQRCGLDVGALKQQVRRLNKQIRRNDRRSEPCQQFCDRLDLVDRILRARGFLPGQSLWEMDHIVAVVEGGGGCGIENLRLLCRPCHVAETRELRARLKRRRAEEKKDE